ncbi:hypothetical protein IAQ61_005416 [Plenodomus lingam]|uniref:uncharacterized protein n=1 Tax=Leptosphaeria maculans TaxID=5022 RepID=UPI003318AF65|nr:hypothetical protein IAQ61_005416 [Plenodomus lingam]
MSRYCLRDYHDAHLDLPHCIQSSRVFQSTILSKRARIDFDIQTHRRKKEPLNHKSRDPSPSRKPKCVRKRGKIKDTLTPRKPTRSNVGRRREEEEEDVYKNVKVVKYVKRLHPQGTQSLGLRASAKLHGQAQARVALRHRVLLLAEVFL